MKIFINEKEENIDKKTKLSDIKKNTYPDSDLIIINGYIVDINEKLNENDKIIFVKKGVIPTKEEFKYQLYARHTPNVQKKLERSTVGIAGLGGLGSNCAVILARIGIGKLILADFDIVEPTNLNRQQYFVSQIGKPKTIALKETLKNINPFIEIITHQTLINCDNMKKIFSECNVIIEAFDRVDMKYMLQETFENKFKNNYLIMASGMAGTYSSLSITIKKLSNNIYIVGDFINSAKKGVGLMSPRVSIVASMQANTAVRILLGETEP